MSSSEKVTYGKKKEIRLRRLSPSTHPKDVSLFLAIIICVVLFCLGGIDMPIPKEYEGIDTITVRLLPSPPTTYVFEEKKNIVQIMRKLESLWEPEGELAENTAGWEISIRIEGEEDQSYRIIGNYLVCDDRYGLLTEEEKIEFRELIYSLKE